MDVDSALVDVGDWWGFVEVDVDSALFDIIVDIHVDIHIALIDVPYWVETHADAD